MSNKFKIKNIWTPEVSREEFAKTLKEWDSALSSFDTKINGLKDAINNVNAKIDDSIQIINNTPLTAVYGWDFISNSLIQFTANRVIRIANNKQPAEPLKVNNMYLLQFEMASYAYRYGYYEMVIRMNDYYDGLTYSFKTPGNDYIFSIKKYNENTIEIQMEKDLTVSYIRLKRLYIK